MKLMLYKQIIAQKNFSENLNIAPYRIMLIFFVIKMFPPKLQFIIYYSL